MHKVNINSFIKKHQLSEQYQQLAEKCYLGIAADIAAHQKSAKKPILLGINGAQGSGKSTLADFLVFVLTKHFQINSVALSLDDFYLTRATRMQHADTVHPLLSTRGVPGTHDVQLAIKIITTLKAGCTPVSIPRFNKAIDDRSDQQDVVNEPVDVLILEGWCVGSLPQTKQALLKPVNVLETEQDTDGAWRNYVNTQLAQDYQTLYGLIDQLIMLKAPSFDCVYQWRLEQEEKLRTNTQGEAHQHVMSPQQVHDFIQFYQRLTEHNLKTLPDKVDYLVELDADRNITQMRKPTQTTQWLVFTDMDGSLLDHYTYSYEPAALTLVQLNAQQIPVIPTTSKTQAELEQFRHDLNNTHPFIIENGAAVLIPQGYFAEQPADTSARGEYWVKPFVEPRAHWQACINAVADDFDGQFITFAQAGTAGIVEMTGLPTAAAALAGQRQYGEPVKWLGDEASKQAFIARLKSQGVNVLAGGRFIHVSGNSDKGVALQWLANVYQTQMPNKIIQTVALGDSQNDVAMLEAADAAVLIRSPAHDLPTVNREDVYVGDAQGPTAWVEGIQHTIEFVTKEME